MRWCSAPRWCSTSLRAQPREYENLNGNKEGFTDYASFGVPDNLLPYMFQPGNAPAVTPNGYGGGNGGGSNWTACRPAHSGRRANGRPTTA